MAGIYIHIPFCSQACYYCDFHFSTSLKTENRVIRSINKDLVIQKKYLKSQLIETVYFGGGTPSLIDVSSLTSIMKTIRNNFKLTTKAEVTIEANPEDIQKKKLLNWIEIGFNRISLGAQSLRNQDLEYMNRAHSAKQVQRAIEVIQNSKINNLSVDLIYGYPTLNNDAWINNLNQLIELNIPHISCYCMTIEPETPLYFFIKKGKYPKLNSNTGKEQFLIARKLLLASGYNHYEISNFSKAGHESRHNQNYWNKTHYLGVGPSAHSFNGKSRRWNIKNNIKYCEKIENNVGYSETERLTKKNIINEYILTSLRTSEGLDVYFFLTQMSKKEFRVFNSQIKTLQKSKLINHINQRIYLTEKGMLLADSISEDLFLI
tara:strand:- start:430 stop:1557 length:1128 start_codon:yes stop_codon:yes gene_type:complete